MLAAMGFPAAHADALGHTVAFDLTATGANQATAYQTAHTINTFATVAAGTGAKLPPVDTWKAGWIAITNGGANALTIYPSSGEYIYPLAVNTGIVVNPTALAGGIISGVILVCAVRSNGNRAWCPIGGEQE